MSAFPGPFVPRPLGAALFQNFAAATAGTLVKTGTGSLQSVVVATGAADATIALYDGVDDTGTPVAAINADATADLWFGLQFNIGLFAVVAGDADIVVTYS